MYKYLFGPVRSRRLGMSLGVDLVPHKTCSMDCIYCECGSTTLLTVERKAYVPVENVILEIEDYFEKNPDPDYVTFSGFGEPCLHSGIGDVIKKIKQIRPKIKVAVLTNGTLLSQVQVQDALLEADLVVPSLDAALDADFKEINRPDPSLELGAVVDGIEAFRKRYQGTLVLEVFIIPGVNDSVSALSALERAVQKIKPDKVQLNTLDRPGTEPGIRAASQDDLQKVALSLKGIPVEITSAPPDIKKKTVFRKDLRNAILETIARRPCTVQDLAALLGIKIEAVQKVLKPLEEQGLLISKHQQRGVFYEKKNRNPDGEGNQ